MPALRAWVEATGLKTVPVSDDPSGVAAYASPGMNSIVQRKETFRKETDHVTRFRCAGGIGILREEVWVNARGEVVRYNLAFLLPHLFKKDHGRVLGYDNAHGVHEGCRSKSTLQGLPIDSRSILP